MNCPQCQANCVCIKIRNVDLNDGYEYATEYTWQCYMCPEEFYSLEESNGLRS